MPTVDELIFAAIVAEKDAKRELLEIEAARIKLKVAEIASADSQDISLMLLNNRLGNILLRLEDYYGAKEAYSAAIQLPEAKEKSHSCVGLAKVIRLTKDEYIRTKKYINGAFFSSPGRNSPESLHIHLENGKAHTAIGGDLQYAIDVHAGQLGKLKHRGSENAEKIQKFMLALARDYWLIGDMAKYLDIVKELGSIFTDERLDLHKRAIYEGNARLYMNNVEGALEKYQESLQVAQSIGHRSSVLESYIVLSYIDVGFVPKNADFRELPQHFYRLYQNVLPHKRNLIIDIVRKSKKWLACHNPVKCKVQYDSMLTLP